MMWIFALLAVLVLGGVAAVAAGRTGTWQEPERDRVPVVLPPGELTGDDLRRVRFPLAVRGYRMSEVDALLDRLANQLESVRQSPADTDGNGHNAQRSDNDLT